MTFPEPIVDYEFLDSLQSLQMEGKPDIVRELFDYFESAGPGKLELMLSAGRDSRFKSLRGEAHSFKSTCHNVGARRLAAVCQKIEDFAAGSDPTYGALQPMLTQLQEEFESANSELNSVMAARVARAD